jgi:flagellar motor switch protein FliG
MLRLEVILARLHERQSPGPVRLRDVEDAQRRIAQVARALEEAGAIVIRDRSDPGEVLR